MTRPNSGIMVRPVSYSADIYVLFYIKKITATGKLLYSILNPDINSVSPSAKSNGVRWVSASTESNQAIV